MQYPPLDERISAWSEFVSKDTEQLFHRYHRPQEVRQLRLALGLAIASILPFIPIDYRAYGGFTLKFSILLSMRTIFIAYAIVALRLCMKESYATRINRILLPWSMAASVGILAVGYTRPPQYVIGFLISVLTPLLITYFVLPLNLKWQVGLCMFGMIGDIGLVWIHRDVLNAVARISIVVNYIGANVMGGAVAWQLHRLSRHQFLNWRHELALRWGLEDALTHVKTLQGYLPICAHCKSVRNDEGYWQAVEVYVREHSEAEFTHGICPDCMKQHYGDALAGRGGDALAARAG